MEERTDGVPVVPPGAPLGSQVRKGETLKAYKRESPLEIKLPCRAICERPLVDYQVDRLDV